MLYVQLQLNSWYIDTSTILPHVVAKCEVNCLVPFCDIVVSLNPNYLLISIMKCL